MEDDVTYKLFPHWVWFCSVWSKIRVGGKHYIQIQNFYCHNHVRHRFYQNHTLNIHRQTTHTHTQKKIMTLWHYTLFWYWYSIIETSFLIDKALSVVTKARGKKSSSRYGQRSRKISKPQDVYIFHLLWNLAGVSAALPPSYLSNLKAIRTFKLPMSRVWVFTRPYENTSYWILQLVPVSKRILCSIVKVTAICNFEKKVCKRIWQPWTWWFTVISEAGIILCMRPANEGSFCVCAQPMRCNELSMLGLSCSLAVCTHKMIPGVVYNTLQE